MHYSDTNPDFMTGFDDNMNYEFEIFPDLSQLDENNQDWLAELADKPEHSYNNMADELNEDEIIPELTEALGEESFQKISDILKEAETFQPSIEPVTTFPVEVQTTAVENFTPSLPHTYTPSPSNTYTPSPSNTYIDLSNSHFYQPTFEPQPSIPQTLVELNQQTPTTISEASNDSTSNSDPDYIPTTSKSSRPTRNRSKGKQPIKNKGKVKSTKGRKAVKVEAEEIVPKENETYSQAVRRVKNNAASRLHRSKKRSNLTTMEQQEENLKHRNVEVAAQLERLDKIAQILKTGLVNHRTMRPV